MARQNLKGRRAVVLLSGGIDSTVSLAVAVREMEIRLVLFFDYGQRALSRERGAALAVASYYALPFKEVDLGWIRELSPPGMRSLTAGEQIEGDEDLTNLEAVWIPNRNGVFLNTAAAYAESYRCEYIVTGFNSEEAEIFPDNRAEYVSRLNRCLALSTLRGIKTVSFTQDLDKIGIVKLGMALSAPLFATWSCYKDGDMMCGTCPSCLKLKKAIDTFAETKRPNISFAH